jgi:hypothetical protein
MASNAFAAAVVTINFPSTFPGLGIGLLGLVNLNRWPGIARILGIVLTGQSPQG